MYNRGDMGAITEVLDKFCDSYSSTQTQWAILWKQIGPHFVTIHDVMNKHIPKTTITQNRLLPWNNRQLETLHTNKVKAYKTPKHYNHTLITHSRFPGKAPSGPVAPV